MRFCSSTCGPIQELLTAEMAHSGESQLLRKERNRDVTFHGACHIILFLTLIKCGGGPCKGMDTKIQGFSGLSGMLAIRNGIKLHGENKAE